ncbi:hypothetical protein [Gelidibacter salicanalis]|uniref:Lipoprotein n=1 Tax=Gelidibacter salicanalis TaxID=291193 RepID=A0A934KUJ4_9FLAO|nr:hypothetical protein [Gelidibacter salicanalis]MBJ7882275.1 hypothetical protein [Gelidibacter salicanalis]
MYKYLSLFAIAFIIVSCGVNKDTTSKNLESQAIKINANKNLIETRTEGVLTDNEGFKDIGSFKYSVFYDATTKDLSKIINIEIIDKSITESYYFADNKLFLIVSEAVQIPAKKIYVHNKKIISSESVEPEEQQLLLEKGIRFQKEFQNNYK